MAVAPLASQAESRYGFGPGNLVLPIVHQYQPANIRRSNHGSVHWSKTAIFNIRASVPNTRCSKSAFGSTSQKPFPVELEYASMGGAVVS
jgi:hypothetical protein